MALTSGELGAELQWLLEFADTDLVIEAILHHLAGQEMGHDVLLLRGAKSPSVSAGQRRLLFLGEDEFGGTTAFELLKSLKEKLNLLWTRTFSPLRTGFAKEGPENYGSNVAVVARPEMQKMLNDLAPNTSYKVLEKVLREIDGDDGDGKYTTPEFVTWLVGKGRNVHTQTHLLRSIVAATGDSLGARVSEIFDRFDVDGSGVLERHELMKVLRVLDSEITTSEIQRILQELDKSKDGKVSYKEFLSWLKEGEVVARKLASKLKAVTGPMREKRVKEAFDMYDLSGDGFLDMEEMRNAMGKMFLFNQEEVHKICNDLDTSNDGVISYKEFSNWMRRGTGSKEVLKGKTILAPALSSAWLSRSYCMFLTHK
ncbi:unnamed protein product [Durusdinium trenchii]|uniref:EF-hand domain-containing protein n=1 Tax=Durusdinium trenchii TaxID=1381693 RepID=A0ABP0JMZ9_9DINO